MEEDPEYKEICDQFAAKSQEFLDAKKEETAKMIAENKASQD
jgi:hypothetical protein